MNDLKLTRRVFGISALSAAILTQTGLSFANTAGFKNPLLLMQPEEILKHSQIINGHPTYDQDGIILIDVRPREEFLDGHIPGARSAPAADNLTGEGLWKSGVRLKHLYEDLGADGESVVAYCGSGVTACADLLGRRIAGLPPARLYVGSWSQWGSDPDRPAEEGA